MVSNQYSVTFGSKVWKAVSLAKDMDASTASLLSVQKCRMTTTHINTHLHEDIGKGQSQNLGIAMVKLASSKNKDS